MAVAGAADTPIGVITDEASAAGEEVNVFLLGAGVGTIYMVASAGESRNWKGMRPRTRSSVGLTPYRFL